MWKYPFLDFWFHARTAPKVGDYENVFFALIIFAPIAIIFSALRKPRCGIKWRDKSGYPSLEGLKLWGGVHFMRGISICPSI